MTQPASKEPIHRFACESMNTSFEVFIVGETKEYAGQAAQESFLELEKLNRELNRFDSTSDIAQLSAQPAGRRLAHRPGRLPVPDDRPPGLGRHRRGLRRHRRLSHEYMA